MCKFSELWKRRFLSETRAFALISMCGALLCQVTRLQQMKRILTAVPAFNNWPFHLQIKVIGRSFTLETLMMSHKTECSLFTWQRPPVEVTHSGQMATAPLAQLSTLGCYLQSSSWLIDLIIDPSVRISVKLILARWRLWENYTPTYTFRGVMLYNLGWITHSFFFLAALNYPFNNEKLHISIELVKIAKIT